MKNYIILTLKVLFIGLFFTILMIHKTHTPRILIVHSYLDDYDWVKEVNVGIRRVLDRHPEVTLRYHYMDTKNHPEASFLKTSATMVHRLIAEWKPDIMILIDDPAQKLVGMEYINNPKMKIVFSGVNAEISKYNYDKADNVTGILERKPLDAIKETGMMIMTAQGKGNDPNNPPRIIFIGDNSSTITDQIPYFSSYNWAPFVWLKPIQVDTYDEWKETVKKLATEADLIMVANYLQLRDAPGSSTFIRPPNVVMTWTEQNSDIPVLGTGSGNVAEGGMITVPVSGFEQGEVAARMALEIAKGKSPKEIKVRSTEQFLIAIRKSAMVKRNLPIPSIYEAFARATENFYE